MRGRSNEPIQWPGEKTRDKTEQGQQGRRPSLVVELIPCICGGQGHDPWNHSSICPRGKAIRKRAGK